MGETDSKRVGSDGAEHDRLPESTAVRTDDDPSVPPRDEGSLDVSSFDQLAGRSGARTGLDTRAEVTVPTDPDVDPDFDPDLDVDAAVRGSQVIFRRTLFLYVLAGGVLVLVDVLTGQFGDALFVHVPFQEAAPILTVSATVAIGLHVAVFNLTHDKTDAPMSSDILVRLDAFSTGGVVVGIAAAAAGLLMLWPVGRGAPDGLDVLGSSLSVVVVVVAGMAGHIVPAAAMSALERARRSYDTTWLTRAVRYWTPRTSPSLIGVLAVLASCVLPAVLVSWATGGFAVREAARGLVWSADALIPPAAFLAALILMLHRRYWLSLLAFLAGIGLTLILAATVVGEVTGDLRALALAACALLAWTMLGVSLRPSPRTPPSGSRAVARVPRVLRHVVAFTLQRRLNRLTQPSRRRSLPGWDNLAGWLSRATGRTTGPK